MTYSKLIAVAALACVAACEPKVVKQDTPAPAVAAPAKPAGPTLSPESFGPVSFGTSVTETESKLGEQALRLDQTDNPECSYVTFSSLPKARFMVEKGIIVRADVDKDIANTTGVNVGDSADLLKQRHPDLSEQVSKYVPTGKDFTIPGKSKTAIVMESDNGKITKVRAGVQPAVSYVEGCG